MIHRDAKDGNSVGISLTAEKFARSFAAWCRTNNINNDADLNAWAAANLTTVAACRSAILMLIKALTDFHPAQPL